MRKNFSIYVFLMLKFQMGINDTLYPPDFSKLDTMQLCTHAERRHWKRDA